MLAPSNSFKIDEANNKIGENTQIHNHLLITLSVTDKLPRQNQ